ncbi:hypothetical protein LR48_Vigan03g054100 [Vigna angularis]|uniref:Uncharacterized protein n=1 Tax=Phaseolus angularis TaxID=3914 RepID=A0A0L9U2Z6_PHAAN|nr:hypothetical protein LR48_Vigan03g054100 [Vigna angularis]
MSSSVRSVSLLWVLMMLLLSANNAMGLVKVTNSLGGDLDLTMYCSSFGPTLHLIRPGNFSELNYSGSMPSGKSPFFCFFQWRGGFQSFDMCVAGEGGGCKQCNWFIGQYEPCRYEGANKICAKWN